MAPRSTKAKKAVDVKVAENDAPKKGRGKGKIVTEDPEVVDVDLDDKPVLEKKGTKRGNKGASDNPPSDKNNETAVPAKKGRKKKVGGGDPEDKVASNGDQSGDESAGQTEESEQNDENVEANGHTEVAPSSGRGRKKQVKPAEKTESKSGRSKKNAKQEDKEEALEDKPKSSGRGRVQKTAKVETEQDGSDVEEEEKPKGKEEEEKPKGKKKTQAKKDKERDADIEEQEDEVNPEPKKKESKSKKGKKGSKEDADEEDESSSKKKKLNKKEEKAKDEEDAPEAKPVKGKRGQKKVTEQADTDKESQDSEPATKRRRKAPEEKEDTKKKAPPKNKSLTDFESLDFSNSSINSNGKQWNLKISSWNVDGIRAWQSKGCLDYLKYEKPNILCLQEVKCSQEKLPTELVTIPGYHAYWLGGDKEGYAGVGIYTTKLAMNVTYGLQNEELDAEGRIITAEYEQFYLVSTYVPNSGRKLVTLPKRLHWNEEFRKHVKDLDKKKPVIICGDMNVSHQEIDLANPKANRKNAGFTDEERQGMTDLLGDGFVDTFRHLYPDKKDAYTFWTYMSNSRARNVGWRLDYFIISERLLPSLCDNVIRDGVYGSDHCPLSLFLHLSSADKPKE